jgi:hypothetical protein
MGKALPYGSVAAATLAVGLAAAQAQEQEDSLVAYLSEAKTGTAVEVSTDVVGRARAEQQAILKPLSE